MESSRFELYARATGAALLVIACLLIIRPFIGAILFAGVLCLSTWPAFLWVRHRVGGGNALGALAMVFAMLFLLALPVALAAQSLFVHSADLVEWVRTMLDKREALVVPEFVRTIPLVGPWLDEYGQRLLGSRDELIELARQVAEPAKTMLVGLGRAIGEGFVQVLLSLFMAFFFYRDGDRVKQLLNEGVTRLAGAEHGPGLVATAQSAVKGVVYGLIGTAIAQAAVAFVGFIIAGVPGAAVLAALTFVLSLVPMGPVILWGGATIWLYANDQTGWAIFMFIYGAAVISSVDNFIKPILMSRAGNLSMLLVVLGVFGGAVAFGFIGLFVGPALLAVGWSLTKAWLDRPAPTPTVEAP